MLQYGGFYGDQADKYKIILTKQFQQLVRFQQDRIQAMITEVNQQWNVVVDQLGQSKQEIINWMNQISQSASMTSANVAVQTFAYLNNIRQNPDDYIKIDCHFDSNTLTTAYDRTLNRSLLVVQMREFIRKYATYSLQNPNKNCIIASEADLNSYLTQIINAWTEQNFVQSTGPVGKMIESAETIVMTEGLQELIDKLPNKIVVGGKTIGQQAEQTAAVKADYILTFALNGKTVNLPVSLKKRGSWNNPQWQESVQSPSNPFNFTSVDAYVQIPEQQKVVKQLTSTAHKYFYRLVRTGQKQDTLMTEVGYVLCKALLVMRTVHNLIGSEQIALLISGLNGAITSTDILLNSIDELYKQFKPEDIFTGKPITVRRLGSLSAFKSKILYGESYESELSQWSLKLTTGNKFKNKGFTTWLNQSAPQLTYSAMVKLRLTNIKNISS